MTTQPHHLPAHSGYLIGPPMMTIAAPGKSPQHARDFVHSVHGGSLLGAGRAASVDFTRLRDSYETHAKGLRTEITNMRSAGATEEQIARHVVAERTNFARSTRLVQGPAATVVLEIRDNVKYGVGGRSYANLDRRVAAAIDAGKDYTKSMTKETLLMEGALRPQNLLNPKFLGAAKYLKYGGPVMLVLGAGLSAKEIHDAAPQDRARVTAEQAGGFIGGELATEVAAVALLTVGTGGLGLVAIAGVALVGVAGGYVGTKIADRMYYAAHPSVVTTAKQTGQIPAHSLMSRLPAWVGGR